MEINSFKTELQQLFSRNKIKTILEKLKVVMNTGVTTYADFLLLCRRFNDIADRKMAGTMSEDNYSIEMNQLSNAILHFIGNLSTGDLKDEYNATYTEVSNPVLVVTTTKSRALEMETFMKQLNFTNSEVTHDLSGVTYGKFDLVIFDNRDLPACPNEQILENLPVPEKDIMIKRLQSMNKFILETSLFIIHFGEYFFWVNKHRQRVHAANSRFSLFARTKEMLDFINTYRV